MKDSTNYPNPTEADRVSNSPRLQSDFLLFRIRIGPALPVYLVLTGLAVIVSPSFITNGTVSNEMVKSLTYFGSII